MRNPEGDSASGSLRVAFDQRLKLAFHGSKVTSDAGLLAYRALDDALGLTIAASGRLREARTGKNGSHHLVGLLRQAIYGRLAGYEGVNDAERLCHDSAMRWIVGGRAVARGAGLTRVDHPPPPGRCRKESYAPNTDERHQSGPNRPSQRTSSALVT